MNKFLTSIILAQSTISFAATTKKAPYPIPSVTRSEIMNFGDTAVGSRYIWGGTQWNPQNKKELGADCSGFVQKSWMFPQKVSALTKLKSSYKIDGRTVPGRLTTAEFLSAQDSKYPWTRLNTSDYSQASRGDAYVYRSNGHGHIVLLSKKEATGPITLEARGRKYGIGYTKRTYAKMKSTGYKIIKRNNIATATPALQ